MVPVMLMAPVLLTVTLPPPDSLIPVTVRVVAVLTRLMLPLLLLLALKVPTVRSEERRVGEEGEVVRVPVVLTRPTPDSVSAVLAVRLPASAVPVEMVPVMLMAPVLLTVTLPPPDSLIPVTVRVVAVLTRLMLPLLLLLALKVPTV